MHVGRLLVTAWVLVDGWMLVVVAGCCCWLLLLVAVAGCCCWLLLLVAAACCCCRLLLLVAVVGCCCWLLNDCCLLLEYCLLAGKSLKISRILMICGWDNFAGEKVFEYFQDFDDLRLKQFCRRRSLWIFSPRWRGNLAKTSFEIVLENFLSDDWVPELWWEESGREFRLGEIDQLTVGSGSEKWECSGYIYPTMAQSYHVT